MDVTLFRDWVIIVYGMLGTVLIITFFVVVLFLYNKVNRLIKKGKGILLIVENTFTSQYYRAGLWLFRGLAAGLGIFSNRTPVSLLMPPDYTKVFGLKSVPFR